MHAWRHTIISPSPNCYRRVAAHKRVTAHVTVAWRINSLIGIQHFERFRFYRQRLSLHRSNFDLCMVPKKLTLLFKVKLHDNSKNFYRRTYHLAERTKGWAPGENKQTIIEKKTNTPSKQTSFNWLQQLFRFKSSPLSAHFARKGRCYSNQC